MRAGLTICHGFDTLRPVLARTTALLTCLLLLGADWPKWPVRRREGAVPNRYAAALLDPASWAPEPEAPKTLDVSRFARALRAVCNSLTPARAEQFARWVDESARAHGEDPFLIAALISRASRCTGDAEEMQGIGLTGIQLEMYRSNVDDRTLTYSVRVGDAWKTREKVLSRPMTAATLANPQAHIEWTAALLAMWREQHDTIDEQFEQGPHRHYVSHFLWGDRVQSPRVEDGLFTERRRLLQHYGVPVPVATREFRGVEWGAPLEGSPRLVSSKPGADRDRGLRMHRGVDVEAAKGEPVLAMADGRVTFAGVDLPGRGTAVELAPERIHRIPAREMGAGGRYVCITHGASSEPVTKASAFAPDPPVTAVPRSDHGQPIEHEEETEDEDGSFPPRATTKHKQAHLAPPASRAGKVARPTLPERNGSLVSCYMHLDTTRVRSGQVVRRGEIIGTVGRTGCKESPAHLHLELKSEHELYDARDVLSGILIGDPPWRSRHEERRARRRARAEGLTSRALSGMSTNSQNVD